MAPHRTRCLCSRLGWKNCPPPRRADLVGWRGTLLLVFSWPREEADGRAGISLTPQTAVSGVRAHCTPQSASRGPRQRPWRAPNDPEKGPGARVQALPVWLEPGARPALPFRSHFRAFFPFRSSESHHSEITRPWRVISSRRDESSVRRGQAESGACKGPESPAAASAPSRRG